ncbi:MAG: hypothetical protein KDB00_14625 [Planctomycetales bacterium]|nr:hypothetical protein [Planctomycetales bacterium]
MAASFGMAVLLAIPAAVELDAAELDSETIVLRSRVFDIPFQMDRGVAATQVRLFVSSDRGKSWETADEQTLPITRFHFEAPSDGEYWFAHSTDLSNANDLPSQLAAERKILIDSSGPAIELTASADVDGKLSAQVKLSDQHKVATLRILYATDVVREWKTVPNPAADADGRFNVQPADDWRQMSVHITATDSLGNVSVDAKTFRRPRFALTDGPRFAAIPPDSNQSPRANPNPTPTNPMPGECAMPGDRAMPNRLRIQTAAGPSDPPSFLLGPGDAGATTATAPSAALPSAVPPRTYPLQSPGSGPLRTPDASSLRSGSPRSGSPRQTSAQPSSSSATNSPSADPPGRALNTFGSAFQDMDRPNQIRINQFAAQDPVGVAPPAVNMSGPKTLPASGLTAKVTPDGIEVLPAPTPDAPQNDSPAIPETLSTPPAELPAPNANASTRSPDDPITEAVPTPFPDGFAPGTASPETISPGVPSSESQTPDGSDRPRSLNEALRPMSPEPETTPNRIPPTPETIPTPAPSRTPQDDRRYRVERAEQISREQQDQFDRAQLARNVPFRFSDSNRFSLDYELEAVGASGVEAVELYGSIDAGRTWKRWGADPDRTSPFDIETKGEGVFAFRIVVLGNNGLKSPRPLPGDTPDIAVIVDQTMPKIKITSARYGEGDRTGSLVIRYECSDENLTNRPVAIAFSDSLDGPWTTIAAGLRNDGLYVWPADPKLPPAIYLRVDATDQAGNKGSFLLDQPIATGGLAPRARILGFRSR